MAANRLPTPLDQLFALAEGMADKRPGSPGEAAAPTQHFQTR